MKQAKTKEEELDKYFPKGDNRRGQAMVILATARLQVIADVEKDRLIARRCSNFKNVICTNSFCLNSICPMNNESKLKGMK